MMGRRSRSGVVTIDAAEVLGEVDDDLLLAEVTARKLDLAEGDPDGLRGNPGEARVVLERALFPKWQSDGQCRAAYDAALRDARIAND